MTARVNSDRTVSMSFVPSAASSGLKGCSVLGLLELLLLIPLVLLLLNLIALESQGNDLQYTVLVSTVEVIIRTFKGTPDIFDTELAKNQIEEIILHQSAGKVIKLSHITFTAPLCDINSIDAITPFYTSFNNREIVSWISKCANCSSIMKRTHG